VTESAARIPFATLAARIHNGCTSGGTIAITASLFAEGTTTVALGLALSLEALLREPILLIDANWTDPALTRGADASDHAGLTDWLRGKVSLESVLRPTKASCLAFLPVGQSPMEGAPLGSLGTLLGAARKRFRYIAVDLPPVLAAKEIVLPWTSAVEQTLTVVRVDATPVSQVRRALAEIGAGRPFQLVINRTGPRQNGYHKFVTDFAE
jgi:Mrp family chromosome partitioning ATPase